jgi:Flp pilus assembly protein TadD
MALGRAAVAASDWKLATAEFTAAVAAKPKDADANNMLAYSYRKSGDLTNAFKFYKIALSINPKHLGALEYQGEAYVMAGKMKEAKANLAKLKAAGCGTKCENYQELAAFIAKPPAKKK